MKFNYKHTLYAGFAGYIVQSIVNSFVPLLFITFQKSYSLPLSRITLLITINFLIQLVIDLLSAGFIRPHRLPGQYSAGTQLRHCGIYLPGHPAGNLPGSLCRYPDLGGCLRHWRRAHRGSHQSHHRSVSN